MVERDEKAIAKDIDSTMTDKELDALLTRESKEYDKVRGC